MTLYFVEILFDGLWSPVGLGHATQQEAEWEIAKWKQQNQHYGDECFRVRPRQLAEPPEFADVPF